MKKIILITLWLLSSNIYAFDGIQFFKEKAAQIKIYVEHLFAGDTSKNITLPTIPDISADAKAELKPQAVEKNILTDEQNEKYNYLFVKELFAATRGSEASDIELSKWLNVMNQGASREGVYRALVLDEMYGGLENFDSPINDTIIKFSQSYMKKFLNRQMSSEGLEKINFYTLKRAMVEKFLEVSDYYLSNNPEDLYKWYAILSSDLAQDYPKLWDKSIRSNLDVNVHLDWAKKVPSQHIKSEIIIKINDVLNYLKG